MALAASFRDVPARHAHAQAIAFAQSAGILQGYADGTFRPDNTINRAEFVKLVIGFVFAGREHMVEMCGGMSGVYSDVPADVWYAKVLCRARDDHLVGGYPDGTFRPDQPVNFAEAAKIIAQGMTHVSDPTRYSAADDGSEARYDGRRFPQNNANPWYRGYVDWLAEYHAIPPDIAAFDQPVTRGQVAEMLYRLVERREDPSHSYDSIGALTGFAIVDVCADLPTRGAAVAASAVFYPVREEYRHLGYLGELLTAEECGEQRLQEFAGGTGTLHRPAGSHMGITLYEPASVALLEWLRGNAFIQSASPANHWESGFGMSLQTLLLLRSHIDAIASFDCPSCYATRPAE